MSGDQVNRTAGDAESPADLLKMAGRFRQHALAFLDDPMGAHLKKHADELEARARRETKATPPAPRLSRAA
jgi:hypothetical protein